MEGSLETLSMMTSLVKAVKELSCSFTTMDDKVSAIDDKFSAIDESIAKYRRELDQIKKKQNDLDKEIHVLRSLPLRDERLFDVEDRLELYVQDINEQLEYHQHFIESIDNKTRDKNLIFHGVPENASCELGSDDTEKVMNVIKKTGFLGDIDNINTERLGATGGNQAWPRPILVKVDNHELQKQLLRKAKQLKNEMGFARIYIKKDLHYTVRRELNRLKRRETQEKCNLINEGVDVKFNWNKRIMTINDMIVDKFKPSFYLPQSLPTDL